VGFADVQESEFFSPPVTTIAQDFGAVGRHSIDVLLRQIDAEGGAVNERLVVPPGLVLRSSTTSPAA
jgi:DNA-binding LacI/PurR family transcriptional regulator